jgi:hypothetical protein
MSVGQRITNIQTQLERLQLRARGGTPNPLGMYNYYGSVAQESQSILEMVEALCASLAEEANDWNVRLGTHSSTNRVANIIHVHSLDVPIQAIVQELELVKTQYYDVPDNQQGMGAHLRGVHDNLKHILPKLRAMRNQFLAMQALWNTNANNSHTRKRKQRSTRKATRSRSV